MSIKKEIVLGYKRLCYLLVKRFNIDLTFVLISSKPNIFSGRYEIFKTVVDFLVMV